MKRIFFSFDETTIADLEQAAVLQKAKKAKKAKKTEATGRHVRWEPPESTYELIREGKELKEVSTIDSLYTNQAVDESLFFIFRHVNHHDLVRNDTLPLYEAVYRCGDSHYIKVQKKHLHMAYRRAGRCRKANMWDILKDGTPMCVDRHCFSMMGQRESKKRYEMQKKFNETLTKSTPHTSYSPAQSEPLE